MNPTSTREMWKLLAAVSLLCPEVKVRKTGTR